MVVRPQNFESPPQPRKAYNHMGAKATRDLVGPDVFADYFTFAIERNPWDAVVSLYYWKYKDRPELPDFETYVQEIWIEQLANNRRLYRIRGKMALDRVLRYENLDDELREVWEHLGLPGEPDLPRAKGNARPAGHYRELYTPASRDGSRRCSPTPSRRSATSSDGLEPAGLAHGDRRGLDRRPRCCSPWPSRSRWRWTRPSTASSRCTPTAPRCCGCRARACR